MVLRWIGMLLCGCYCVELLSGAIVRPMNKGLQKFICKPLIFGAPGRIRTHDPLVRSQVLYPTELRAL
jgi:hypothetical protein